MENSRPGNSTLGMKFQVETDVAKKWCEKEPQKLGEENTPAKWCSCSFVYRFMALHTVDGKQIHPGVVFGRNTAPWSRRSTRIGGNDSNKLPVAP